MYATHFDLEGRLFAPGIAQDDAWFVDARDADQGLPAAVALSAPDSVLVLVGPPGVGKTAFAAQALRTSTGGMRCAVAWLGMPPASPHELLELLLAEFGFEPYRQSRAERVQTWRQFLTELGATQTRVFVAVERAHDFDAGILAALDALTTADANACPGASLLLMGTEQLVGGLDEPSLEPLRQRVRLVRRLRPLDAAGIEGYLRHAAARAGGTLERLFSAEAVAALARHSAGVPRLLNHLAEGALALAALRGAPLVDGELVAAVAAARGGTPLTQVPADDRSSAAQTPADDPPSAAQTPADDPPIAAQPAPDDIPVLTESVAGEHGEEALDPIDAAATLTLLGDDLDQISAEIAAEMLAVDGALAAAEVSDAPTAETPAAAADPGAHAGDGHTVADTRETQASANGGRAGAGPRRRASG